jgi:hypothetical protein
MNIVGEGLPEAIGKQVEIRQKIYGSINRTTEETLYLNSRTSFVKAISSVNIENYDTGSIATRPELIDIIKEYGGDKLARNFILFNGTSKEGGSLRAGIPTELLTGANQYVNNLAYGLGGLEYGIRPMPGIISMQTTSKGANGSVEETILNIKAWNRVQFEIIDILYLRLGYSVLVEWGNTSYFNNNGDYISENSYTLEPEFLNGKLNPDSIYSKIQSYKLKSNGNYDAIYGIVTNFNWTFDQDGGYNITVKLLSKGDIIESIKSMSLISQDNSVSTFEIPESTLITSQASASAKLNEANPQDATIVAGITTTEQEAVLKDLATQNTTNTTSFPTVEDKSSVDATKDVYTIARLYYNVRNLFSSGNSNVYTDNKTLSQEYFQPDSKDAIPYITQVYIGPNPDDKKSDNGTNLNKKYYIRLGSLLAFIQANLIPKEKQGDSLYSSLKIDYATESNLMYTNPYQVSVDPNVCLINTEITPTETIQIPNSLTTYKFASQGSPFKKTISGVQVGKIMNIYVNFECLIKIINSNGDPKNQTSIYTLIETLCNEISVSLGGINTLRPFIDTSTNTLKIIDETALPNKNSIIESLGGRSTTKDPTFQIYGYDNPLTLGEAGFVRDFRFTSKLDPSFATIISIGATSQGGIISEDATAFTTLNRGLKDRIKPEIFASTGYNTTSIINIENTSPEDQFKESLTNFEKYLGSIGYPKNNPYPPTLNEAETLAYKTLLTEIMLYIETRTAVKAKKSSGTMGFIPVSVGLTLDGLSGLKLLNGIKVDTSYLPSNYPETMLFVISKLAHKVENNIWTTELETIMIPTDVSQPGDAPKAKSRRSSGANIGSNQTTGREAITTAEQNRRGVQIINFFIGKGLTAEQAAGIAGNFFAESGLQLNIVNSIGAYGLAQWLGQRKQNLFAFASNRGESVGNISLETQLEFTWNELQSTEGRAYRGLIAQTTIEGAATSFVNRFERPSEAEKAQSLNKRIAYARKFLNERTA